MEFVISTIDDNKDGNGFSFDFDFEDLNKTVFLTREEAEEALKKAGGENETD